VEEIEKMWRDISFAVQGKRIIGGKRRLEEERGRIQEDWHGYRISPSSG